MKENQEEVVEEQDVNKKNKKKELIQIITETLKKREKKENFYPIITEEVMNKLKVSFKIILLKEYFIMQPTNSQKEDGKKYRYNNYSKVFLKSKNIPNQKIYAQEN
jgi:hypothetical protein